MDWTTMLAQLFELVLFPMILGLGSYLIILLRKKSQEISNSMDDATKKKYVEMLAETISDCVSATTQTYVESLKAQGKFDAEAQKEAFKMSYTAVFEILSEDAKVYLSNIYGDLSVYVTQKIEAQVKASK